MIVCKFNIFAVGSERFASILSAVKGWSYTGEDIMKIGERIYYLEREFNVREGANVEQDTVPK